MIVLFLNLHKPTPEGITKFQRYYTQVTSILKQSIYYGTYYDEQIRTKDNLDDYLYDDFQMSTNQKAKQKFQSVSYIFVDGPINLPPWSMTLSKVSLLICNSLKEGKKVHFNGFGHTSAYYHISTGFQKGFIVRRKCQNDSEIQEYAHDEETGHLLSNGRVVCNSGVQVIHNQSRFFRGKSKDAISKGAVLPTKFHYLAFNTKNSDTLIGNIEFPFTFFEKSKVFCVPLPKTRAKVVSLIETQDKIPIAFQYNTTLSTHLLCPETIKLLTNWLISTQQVKPYRQIKIASEMTHEIAFDNFISAKGTKSSMLNSHYQTQRRSADILRTQSASSSKSKFDFQKPSVRCSGPYQSFQYTKLKQQINNKTKLKGRSRMMFKCDSQKDQIKNYVQMTPSRPPSAHIFREINKEKWMIKRNFFVT